MKDGEGDSQEKLYLKNDSSGGYWSHLVPPAWYGPPVSCDDGGALGRGVQRVQGEAVAGPSVYEVGRPIYLVYQRKEAAGLPSGSGGGQ